MGVDPEEQVEILQARIHERLAQLRAIGQGVRVGPGGHESLDSEPDSDEGGRADGDRQIDLTDGIDLTDARLAEAGWDDRDDQDDDEPEDDEVAEDGFGDLGSGYGSGGLLEDGFGRRRPQRHRSDPGPADDGDPGPRLLGDDEGHRGREGSGRGSGWAAGWGSGWGSARRSDAGRDDAERDDAGWNAAWNAAERNDAELDDAGSGFAGPDEAGQDRAGRSDAGRDDAGRSDAGWDDELGPAVARDRRPRRIDLRGDSRSAGRDSGRGDSVGPTTLQEATDAVIDATRELISYERRLPMLLDAEPRRLSLLIVRWSGVLTAAVAGSLLVAGLAGWLPRWWTLPALICGGAGFLLLRLPVHPPGDRHELLRPGSVVVAFGALLTAICAASGMPLLVLLLGAVSMAAGIWHVQQTPPRIGALPRRFR